jgi:hypothetical protein
VPLDHSNLFNFQTIKQLNMKRLLIIIFCIFLFNSASFSQSAKPNKVGLIGDFVGVVTFSGMNHGFKMFSIYSEDLRSEVNFNSGFGIKNPPNVNYGRFKSLLGWIDADCQDCLNYVVRVKAKSVYQYDDRADNIADRYKIVWTPTKITLISTTSSMPK